MNATIPKVVYEVRYTGAPYGAGEDGHTLSSHETLDDAMVSRFEWERRGGDQYKVVKLVDGQVVPLVDDDGTID